MGIKNFFTWYRNNPLFKQSITKHVPQKHTDHILVDMNGIIHEAAQRAFRYGKYTNCKTDSICIPLRLQHTVKNVHVSPVERSELELFENIKIQVNQILQLTVPTKTVFLAIDGVAPKSKQNQQRQRRFRAAQERTKNDSFDSACITAGTDFMKRLSNYLSDLGWLKVSSNVNCIFSSSDIPGEGEHKLIEWIKCNENTEDSFTVVGMDADLILLCLAVNKINVFIMREKEYGGYDWLDINYARENLHNKNISVHDIIVWSCFLGNDFLPPIPSLEIKESFPEQGALDFFFDEHKEHLVVENVLNFKEIKRLLLLVSNREQKIMEARAVEEKTSYMKDREGKPVTRFPNSLWTGNIEDYRSDYFVKKLVKTSSEKNITHERVIYAFLKTIQWVYTYYTKQDNIDWNWFYPYNYALHASDFVKHIKDTYTFEFDNDTQPCHPHEQLLRVIPPQSRHSIPECLWNKHLEINNNNIYEIDMAGKRYLWEATTIVNFV